MQTCDESVGELAQEIKAQEEAEKRMATLEAEKEGVDARWHSELEAKQSTIVNLQTHRSKQPATIHKLKGEVAKLKEAVEGSQRETAEWKNQAEQLEQQVKAERREKLSTQENLHSERLALQSLKIELDESKTVHQTALADAQSIETQLKYMMSEEGKRETIEGYRQGPMGKVELSLAVTPLGVQSCIPVLLGLEERGAGVQLGVGNGDDDKDDNEDEDDNDDEGDNGDGGDRS